MDWLGETFPTQNAVIYYGFDASEKVRITRRSRILGSLGFKTEFPLAFWPRTILSTTEIGVTPPLTYSTWKHANCIGCLKAGRQHWYCVYCLRPEIWAKAKLSEEQIGYSIMSGIYLDELEPLFEAMKQAGIVPTEKTPFPQFWKEVRQKIHGYLSLIVRQGEEEKPCECMT